MTDYAKLKELAEAAEGVKPGRWFVHRDGLGPQFEPHPQQNLGVDDSQGCVVVWHGVERMGGIPYEEVAEYIAAANPAVVLGLLAENDQLSDELSACTASPGGCTYWREAAKLREQERDQLKVEIAQLKNKEIELKESEQEANDLCDRLAGLLHGAAIAVKGPEAPLSRHSFHDVPACVKTVIDESHQLRAFANEMVGASFEGGSFDGGDIGDIAVKHGLLRIEQRDGECAEVCACREYGFPAECYRKTPLLIIGVPQ